MYPMLSGFGNEFASEAIAGTLPPGQNSPQRVAHGLYAEQVSGTPFTVPRHVSRRSWLYRIRPSAMHGRYRPLPSPGLCATLLDPDPNRMRWNPLPIPDEPTDFVAGLVTILANADTTLSGVTVHVYRANQDMRRVFWNADGELLIVPQQGRLEIATEMGRLSVAPGSIAVIPRGIRFRVTLPDGVVYHAPIVGRVGTHARRPCKLAGYDVAPRCRSVRYRRTCRRPWGSTAGGRVAGSDRMQRSSAE